MRDREKALAVMDDLLDELQVPVALYGSPSDIDNDDVYTSYSIEIRPHQVNHEQMAAIMEIVDRHDLELYWYSFNNMGHMRVVEPGEVRE